MNPAPITLFAYNRPWHTKNTIDALKENHLAEKSDLIIFSDGPRSDDDKAYVESVRRYLNNITGFNKVSIVEREKNFGLSGSIISGVTAIVKQYGQVIVVEDDLVSSPYFLKFMNDGLDFYRNAEDVISIHGYIFPVEDHLPDTFFLKGADCWGWATWARGWALFNPDGKKLLEGIREGKLKEEFDYNGAYPFTKMLQDQTKGRNDSWAIRWHASAFLSEKLTLFPGRSLIRNIGIDQSGVHSGETKVFDTEVSREPITISDIPIEENHFVKGKIERYYRKIKPGIAERIKNNFVRIFR
jgi:hypothetical protein